MMKLIFISLWTCAVALGASAFAAQWKAEVKPAVEEPYVDGLEYRKLEPMTVPMISDGAVTGYVLARLVFTAEAGALRKLSVEPEPFVADEAFREIYENGKVEFGQLAKYNLDDLSTKIKENANQRLGPDVIQDVLIEEINYVDRRTVQGS